MLAQRGLRRIVAAAVLASASAAACGGVGDEQGDGPALTFVQANSIGVPLDAAASGAAVKADLVNRTDAPITITAVEPVTDPGLRVTYLGHTTCKRGCPGAEGWTEDKPGLDTKELVERTIGGTVPLTVRPKPDRPSLLFRLQVTTDGLDAFRRGCRYLRAVKVTFSTGRTADITFDGRSVAGLQLEEPHPGGYHECEL